MVTKDKLSFSPPYTYGAIPYFFFIYGINYNAPPIWSQCLWVHKIWETLIPDYLSKKFAIGLNSQGSTSMQLLGSFP